MQAHIEFTASAYRDYLYWKKHDLKRIQRIEKLCRDILAHPFKGIGKPEALKFGFQGCWSRRIDREHRLVYQVKGGKVIIVSRRYHY